MGWAGAQQLVLARRGSSPLPHRIALRAPSMVNSGKPPWSSRYWARAAVQLLQQRSPVLMVFCTFLLFAFP